LTAGVCVIHVLRNSFRYAGRQAWEKIARDLRPVCTAPIQAAAKERFAESTAVWGEKYRAIVQLWQNDCTEFLPFQDYGVFVAADRAALSD
jgi:putative transposase